jgi:RNA polymerase sigma factor (sigma-70 family)
MRAGGKWEKGYLFAAIRNRYVDRVRRNRKILFVSLDGEAESNELTEESLAGDLVESDVLESGMLHRALGALRPDERETLFLAVVEGHTAHEIASMTHRPRGTVLSLLHRTKQKLRRLPTTRENAS